MRKLRNLLFLVSLLAGADVGVFPSPGASVPAGLRLVANPSFPVNELSLEEVQAIFLYRRTQMPGGVQLEPVTQRAGPAHEHFCEAVLEKTAGALESFYRSRVFSGTGFAPRSFASESALVQYVARTRGAIGYVLEGSPLHGVKIVSLKAPPEGRRGSGASAGTARGGGN